MYQANHIATRLDISPDQQRSSYYRARYYDPLMSRDKQARYFAASRGAIPSKALLELEITSLAPSVSRISAKSSM
jgi:hypothetical protein